MEASRGAYLVKTLVDTDVLIDHLRGQSRFDPTAEETYVSAVTRAELFAGSESDERRVRTLLAPMIELEVDRAVAERAGRVRRTTGLELPDALIAATALEHHLTLVTRNRRDFQRVRGLRLADEV